MPQRAINFLKCMLEKTIFPLGLSGLYSLPPLGPAQQVGASCLVFCLPHSPWLGFPRHQIADDLERQEKISKDVHRHDPLCVRPRIWARVTHREGVREQVLSPTWGSGPKKFPVFSQQSESSGIGLVHSIKVLLPIT